MTTITKERIELFIKNPLENGLTRGEQMELARIAMASLEAKPVRYLNKFSGVCVTLEQQSNAADDVAVYIPLYTAQPAPVVPDEMATSDDMNLYQKSFAQGYNACRAAMLQGGQPVSNRDELSSPVIPDGYALVPIVPTEDMVINGFESEPDPHFSDEKVWAEYEALSGCRRAARRAELCWAAMIKAAPKQEGNNG
ncbi:hypothetical protein YT61_004935 [Salmonella enterica subsp. enterica]|uniref:Eaa protein n=1 Tax=Salmonella enterica subsp. enterica serovar Bareilly TaxID=58096 RepID=A0A5U9SIS9_SALET|nr:hypothetical protein [Salmonella enterica]EBS4096499.1 hypothetical protein [Salmonella enterica subsp. enterica serovar Bareilly]EBS5898178.1 hypothetical protein [Salmonella enterica subsp. enterica serovar Fluntern]EBV2307207.1 hypothetical protein [Salmonella enterica subsp. enterica serovar Reading]ECI0553441.1 hypothetical protein [Salmonella enterica subsp. enterica]EDK8534587.1 hypothetical protein [Salmonella enterica subsp. enterica serovar Give]EDQ2671382.1 hypothetical protein 